MPGTFQRDSTTAAADFTKSPALSRLTVVVFFSTLGTSFIQPLYLINLQARFDPNMQIMASASLSLGLVYAILLGYLGRLAQRLGRGRSMILG
ncbi:MAG: hypothetical protein CMQ29_10320 [Gammaproteobacteria bacterium]|nr:hypothetical protein [Gammaproteobacteria bacterium]